MRILIDTNVLVSAFVFIEAELEHPLVLSPSMLYDYLLSQQG